MSEPKLWKKSCVNCWRTGTYHCTRCEVNGELTHWKGTVLSKGEHLPGCACKLCLPAADPIHPSYVDDGKSFDVVGPAQAAQAVEKAIRRTSASVLVAEGHYELCTAVINQNRAACNCAAGTLEQRDAALKEMTGSKREGEAWPPHNTQALPSAWDQRKAAPIYSGVMSYFPRALAAIARLSKNGNDKHNPGQPLHWSQDKSNDHADCILRHQADAGTIDPDDGLPHTVKVAWRALAQLEVELQIRDGGADCHHPNVRWSGDAGEPVCLLCGFGLRSQAHRDP